MIWNFYFLHLNFYFLHLNFYFLHLNFNFLHLNLCLVLNEFLSSGHRPVHWKFLLKTISMQVQVGNDRILMETLPRFYTKSKIGRMCARAAQWVHIKRLTKSTKPKFQCIQNLRNAFKTYWIHRQHLSASPKNYWKAMKNCWSLAPIHVVFSR